MNLPLGVPLLPGPGQAQEWLQRELARSEYRRSLLQRVTDWVQSLLDKIGDQPGRFSDLGWPLLLVVVLVLVVVLALVLSRLRRNPALEDDGQGVFDDVRRSAAEHRELARAAYAAGDLDTAVVEAVRAITAGLVERGAGEDVPAATAFEVVARVQPRFPALADRLGRAAQVFDETRYGGRHASGEQAAELLDLEQTLAATTPASGDGDRSPVAAVPR